MQLRKITSLIVVTVSVKWTVRHRTILCSLGYEATGIHWVDRNVITHIYTSADLSVMGVLGIGDFFQRVAAFGNADGVDLVSEMDPDFVKSLFLTPMPDAQSALDAALAKLGANATVLAMPFGGSTLPRIK